MIAVLGASGFLGLHTLRACAGIARTRAVVRRQTHWLKGTGASTVYADLDQPESLRPALEGVRVLVHAAGHYPRLSTQPEATLATALRQSEAVCAAAAAAGVERVILLSTVATVAPAHHRASTEEDRYRSAPDLGVYHRTKWWIERTFTQDRRFSTTVLCPGACLGPGDWRLGTQAALLAVARGRPVVLPDGLLNPVDARDVGRAVARVVMAADAPCRLILASENVLASTLIARVQGMLGVRGLVRILPVDTARALADAEERRAEQSGGRPALSREIVDLLAHGHAVDTRLAEQALGLRWTPFARTLDDFLAWSGAKSATNAELEG